VLDGDVTRVLDYSTRFAGIVYPGETLTVNVWREANCLILNATVADRDNAPALDSTTLTHA
jgi:hypothetical protein